jgi:hypothetical protein
MMPIERERVMSDATAAPPPLRFRQGTMQDGAAESAGFCESLIPTLRGGDASDYPPT